MASHAIPFRRPILRLEEAAGLVVAVAAHLALAAWLALKPPTPAPLPVPERMTVTFSADVADQSTAPKPAAEAAPAIAPVVSAYPVPDPAPEPVATPVRAPRAEPLPRQPSPPKPQPLPKPPAKAQLQPKPLPQTKPSPLAKPLPAKLVTPPKPAARSAPALTPAKAAPPARSAGGASRFGDAFRAGIPGGQNPAAKANEAPAQTIGPAVKAALSGSIARQLKPKWSAPQGAEADQLVTVLSWELNPDGTLAGPPRLVSQTGITDANRPQAQRHVEQAMRAVRLAAPFDLPPDLYPAWKRVGQFRFDRKLSQ